MRHSALCQGLALTAAATALCAAAPARANTAVSAPKASVHDSPTLTAHYDRASRIVFIGANPQIPAVATDIAHVTISRTADLVGQPLRLVWSRGTAFGSNLAGSGLLPNGMPVMARSMTSRFGMRAHPTLGGYRAHSGVDLAAPTGSPIVATSDGRVGAANWNGGYGLFVALEHGSGIETRYGHMSRLNVVAGQQVKKGQVIGYVGSTGRSTGPHLHYEVRQNGRAVDPAGTLGGR